jgi:hypothetical protein
MRKQIGAVVICGLALILGGVWASCGAFRSVAFAADSGQDERHPHFTDPERVQQFLDNRPDAAVKLLESVLSQEQVDALEKAMFPEPGNDERQSAYEQVQTILKRIGLGSDDALVQGVSARIESLEGTTLDGDKP